MITDDQGTQILKKMDEQFNEVNKKMDEGFRKVDKRLEKVDEKFEKMDEKFEVLTRKMGEGFQKVDERFDQIDKKLEIIEIYVANHDNQLKKLPTRDEFEKHEKQNLEFQYAVAKKLEMKKFAKA